MQRLAELVVQIRYTAAGSLAVYYLVHSLDADVAVLEIAEFVFQFCVQEHLILTSSIIPLLDVVFGQLLQLFDHFSIFSVIFLDFVRARRRLLMQLLNSTDKVLLSLLQALQAPLRVLHQLAFVRQLGLVMLAAHQASENLERVERSIISLVQVDCLSRLVLCLLQQVLPE